MRRKTDVVTGKIKYPNAISMKKFVGRENLQWPNQRQMAKPNQMAKSNQMSKPKAIMSIFSFYQKPLGILTTKFS